MKFAVLNENTAGKRGFLAEHGLSVLIFHEGRKLLFDTGQTDVFLHNAERVGETLSDLDGIILSHGHFDHCGGLEYLAERHALPPVYVRKNAFLNKQAVNSDKKTYRVIGIPWKQELIRGAEILTEDKQEIFPGVWVLGNVPYTVPFEKRPELFFIDRDGEKQPDYMEDEQLLVIDTEKGLCVFAGCCHAGIVNCLSYVKNSFPGRPVYSVLAGMHLSAAGDERIDQTIEALKAMEIPVLMPVHCTGIYGIGKMKTVLKDRCRIIETGAVLEL
ncbi:MAG: MBL fold metallo-hydrolase [Clostridium sp.]|jgi:7,8-dihydropterin-6-yl-methyl-4-(beta-D-ribofuranosyl)aminobenzene 5'-phosphate synthase|nr:MBL fold metallo-hydrolase [Clostridium sp.]